MESSQCRNVLTINVDSVYKLHLQSHLSQFVLEDFEMRYSSKKGFNRL